MKLLKHLTILLLLISTNLFYSQTEARINVGGGSIVDNGISFSPDTFYFPSDSEISTIGSIPQGIYKTLRFSRSSVLEYKIPIQDGEYDVILHFVENFWTSNGGRLFDIQAEGTLLEENFDIRALSGGTYLPLQRSYVVNVTGNQFDLYLTSVNGADFPAIAGIEVIAKNLVGDNVLPTISSFTNTSKTSNSITLSWSATDNIAVTQYVLTMNGVSQTLSSATTTTITIDNLNASTPYDFQLTASDAANNAVTSQVLAVTTLDYGETPVSGGQWSTATNENDVYFNIGNVGIGTATPDVKLAVNGHIRAKEIKVENANWPDYVFSKDYELLSLKEIQKHIQEKGHLPNMPSAKEVEANGIELGEMNRLLLEKIEELTLHIINQEAIIKKIAWELETIKTKN